MPGRNAALARSLTRPHSRALQDRPKAVHALFGKVINEIHCGAEYSIAISDKETYSWGWGDFGRLGHASSADVGYMTSTDAHSRTRALAHSHSRPHALLVDLQVFVPQPVASLSGRKVSAVACGDTHTLCVVDGGRLMSFGRGVTGQLGNGSALLDCYEPREVAALKDEVVTRVACGAEHSACCTSDGKVYSWGWGRYGNIGDGDTVDRHEPVLVKGLDGVNGVNGVKIVEVACGWRHSGAIDEGGALYTWGWGRYGQLGHGDDCDQTTPRKVEKLLRRVKTFTGGWRHSGAIDEDGALYTWGWNRFGQLGLGHTRDVNEPTAVSLPACALVTSGWRHTMTVTTDGRLYTFGRGVGGQLGVGEVDGGQVSLPTEVRIDVERLESEAHVSVPVNIAPADRYALVPDQAEDDEEDAAVPEKRQRLGDDD